MCYVQLLPPLSHTYYSLLPSFHLLLLACSIAQAIATQTGGAGPAFKNCATTTDEGSPGKKEKVEEVEVVDDKKKGKKKK